MNTLYEARDFFKSILLPTQSNFAGKGIEFLSESYYNASGMGDTHSVDNVLLSVCTINNSVLRLVFNKELGCDEKACFKMQLNIAKKTGLSADRVIAIPGQMKKAHSLRHGDQVAHQALPTYGSLGGFTANGNQLTHIVSNNHVLADTNKGKVGDIIFKKGINARQIGVLVNKIDIAFGGAVNYLDIAVGRLLPNEYINISTIAKVRNPVFNEHVRKFGATTGPTDGIVRAIDDTVRVDYGGGRIAAFEDQLLIQTEDGSPFSRGGDSGSFIWGYNGDLIGLLFAGIDNVPGLPNETSANHGSAVGQQLINWGLI